MQQVRKKLPGGRKIVNCYSLFTCLAFAQANCSRSASQQGEQGGLSVIRQWVCPPTGGLFVICW